MTPAEILKRSEEIALPDPNGRRHSYKRFRPLVRKLAGDGYDMGQVFDVCRKVDPSLPEDCRERFRNSMNAWYRGLEAKELAELEGTQS